MVYISGIVCLPPETDHEQWLSGLEKSVNDFNLTLQLKGFVSLDYFYIFCHVDSVLVVISGAFLSFGVALLEVTNGEAFVKIRFQFRN